MNAPIIHIGGQPVPLGRKIGKGGEGEVYQLASDPAKAVKVYFQPDQLRFEKVNAIVQAGLASRTKLVSFPTEIATDSKGRFLGFTMNLVSASKPLHELYAPKARKHNFPEADYRFLVRTARNAAAAVGIVHNAGCVVGDINHSGFLISDRALVAIIDADSFQVSSNGTNHLCRVGVLEYTPPELQGKSLDQVVRTINHDAFGLAVAIFQLLFLGKHPFAGRYSGADEMPLERAIAEGRYAYSALRQTGMAPPPHGPRPSIMPKAVAMAFEQAFTADANRVRPSARDWVNLIGTIESSLVVCPTHKEHFLPKDAGSCPWCAMDNQFGTVLFPPVFRANAVSPATVANFDLNRVWAAIEAVALPDPKTVIPQLPLQAATPSNAGNAAVSARFANRALGLLILGAAGGLVAFVPALWWIALGIAAFGLNRFNSKPEALTQVSKSLDQSRSIVIAELEVFHRNSGSIEPFRMKGELERARQEYQNLSQLQAKWHSEYQDSRRKQQLTDHLDRFRVDKERIQSINRGLAQTLVAYGYETAADIDHNVTRVPGIGDVRRQRLLDWKRRHEARFAFNPNPTPADQAERQKIDQKVVQMRSDLQKRLISGADALRDAIKRVETSKNNPHAGLVEAYRRFAVSEADAKMIGITVPPFNLAPPDTMFANIQHSSSYSAKPVSPVALPSRSTSSSGSPGRVTCPKCGSHMVSRLAHRGRHAGKRFWGCSRYPSCDGIKNTP
ncbi:helix-hairpin-helix domain-containing protein [Mesorhizobium sp. Cs1299R1N3]|uniref:helix-hairpin-helix domain-containing protein n=1 Tax=Mesorhizobium sp. Cs1299R1N3 TaxID=3015173 RepID=UPI00301CB481